MSKKTHKKELERARAKRMAERAVHRSHRNRILGVVLVLLVAAGAVAFALVTRDDNAEVAIGDPNQVSEQPSTQPAAGACEHPGDGAPQVDAKVYDTAPQMQIDENADYRAIMETTCGTIEIDLFEDRAPQTVNNFVALARDGYYDGTPFHRVIDGFMIQGGDPSGTGTGGTEGYPGYTIPDELDATAQIVADEGGYAKGYIAMARPSNPDGSFRPDSAGSQFFIMQSDSPYNLPPQYTIFGRATSGLDIIDSIALGPVQGDQAIDPVRIISVTIEGP